MSKRKILSFPQRETSRLHLFKNSKIRFMFSVLLMHSIRQKADELKKLYLNV